MFPVRRKSGWLALTLGIVAAISFCLASEACAANPSWLEPGLLAKAKKEGGTLTVYGSMNQVEALPLFARFDKITGLKTSYVRASDVQLEARVEVEHRAGKRTWDVLQTTAVHKLPPSWLAQINPPEAKAIPADAKDPDRRWFGVYANYNTPAYNTEHVKASELPKAYADFLRHPEWKGHIAINQSDDEWFYAMCKYMGEKKATKLVSEIVKKLDVRVVQGHGGLARDTASGQYWISLNNYVNLTVRTELHNNPIAWWPIDPVAVFYGEVGVAADAPHPAAARLAANYLLSRDAQQQLAKTGRIPTRRDVVPKPKDVFQRIDPHKVVPAILSGHADQVWQQKFNKVLGIHLRF